jgi:hypothetical protein
MDVVVTYQQIFTALYAVYEVLAKVAAVLVTKIRWYHLHCSSRSVLGSLGTDYKFLYMLELLKPLGSLSNKGKYF